MQESTVIQIPIEQIQPGRFQPRTKFDEGALDALAETIRTHGVIAPIIVRRLNKRDTACYEIVAGERRWRAVQRLGWTEVPCLVRDLDDVEAAAATLVENLQREDLGPMETARAIAKLHDQLGLDQSAIGSKIGCSQSSVAHYLRLLTLPRSVQGFIDEGKLSFGHAKALFVAPEAARYELARRAVRTGCSVRQLERWVKAASKDKWDGLSPTNSPTWLQAEERRISETVGAKVELIYSQTTGSGKITLHFSSLDEYEGLSKRLVGEQKSWD